MALEALRRVIMAEKSRMDIMRAISHDVKELPLRMICKRPSLVVLGELAMPFDSELVA